jgi:plasmid stabilization system protein ParE
LARSEPPWSAGYRLAREAAADLFEIWRYIASNNIDAADRVEVAIYEAFAFLARRPGSGRSSELLTSLPVRFWNVQAFPNYLIVYRAASPLEIIRVLHARRDIKRVLARS